MKKGILIKTCILCIFLIFFNISLTFAENKTNNKNNLKDEEVHQYINDFFQMKNKIFFSGDLTPLFEKYDISQNYGKYSLEHEIKRFKYLRDWANERGIIFTEISSNPIIKRINCNGNYTKIRIDEEYKFKYIYKDEEDPIENQFGIAVFHNLKLKKINNRWKIYNDYYLDCFEDALKSYTVNFKEKTLLNPKKQKYDFTEYIKPIPPSLNNHKKNSYNRVKAVEYADRYCGIGWVNNGKKPKYNKNYKNFTGAGGNCTNYVSQCLGDKKGGNLRYGGGWHFIKKPYGQGDGSSAWVNADAFKNCMLYSGKGKLIKKGNFDTLIAKSDSRPNGYIGKLQIGDVICYAKKHDIDHTAIVTGFDSHGYPLINSHTVDRYHVPFDLGWGDKDISFFLIHVR